MTDYKRRSQEYYDNLEHLNIKKENIFYRQNEKNSLVSSNLDKDETLKKYTDYKNKFRPKIIAKDPSTFCFFGSAKSRYENSIYNILNYYPFDGTQQEAINWLSSSSTLDIALVEKHWPSSVGHINFTDTAKECINFYAGPQKIAGSEYTGKLQRGETALRLDPSKGNTVEFWLKKGAWLGNTGDSEHIFDIGTHPSHITAGADEFRFRISLAKQQITNAGEPEEDQASPFSITYKSGSVGFTSRGIGGTFRETGRKHDAYIDDKWHHYAFKVYQAPREDLPTQQTIYAEMFMDGKKIDTQSTNVNPAVGSMGSKDSFMAGCIGNFLNQTEGKLLGSIDDFRFWKGKRTNRQISRYYDKKVYASTIEPLNESVDYISRLGVYYKFNKKAENNTESDSIVLDYSGNDVIAKIHRYNTTSTRVATSAIDLSEISKNTEIPDLNLIETDPSVMSLKDELVKIATSYDKNNHNSILKMIPNWANDPYGSQALNEKSDFYILLNMIAEEFDEIKLNIDSIRSLTNRNFDTNYVSLGESGKEIAGVDNPGRLDLFTCQDTTEDLDIHPGNRIDFAERNLEKLGFKIIAKPLELNTKPEDDFENIVGNLRLSLNPTTTKRLILDNVLIAATSIIKKKGTERALDQMLSCWGVGRDLVSLNVYGQNSEISLDKPFKNSKLIKLRSFDFSLTPESVFYMSAPHIPTPEGAQKTQESLRYIPANANTVKESNITFQGDFIFPTMKKDRTYDLDTSIFGIREMDITEPKLLVVAENSNKAWMQARAVRPESSSTAAKFVVNSPLFGSDVIESPYIDNVYDNTRWNLSLRVHRVGDEESRFLEASTTPQNNSWEVRFSGYNYILDSLQNSFSVSKTITQAQYEDFIRSNRHVFIGAEKENITGSISSGKKANFKFLDFKVWNSSIAEDELKNLSQNVSYWGRSSSSMHNSGLRDTTPKNKDLIFKINMSEHTSVPTNGILSIRDFTSGSMDDIKSLYGKTLGSKYPFVSTVTDSTTRDATLQTEFITAMVAHEPELISTNEEVKLRQTDLAKFDINTKDESRIISFEKSLYKQISREMIDFLSGIKSLNNLIGEPVNKYRQNYKLMDHFRQVFYNNVENESQFERFVEYYRWIDYSLGTMLEQIIPASSQSNTKLQNVIESHVLERNKYHHKFPLAKSFQREFEAQMRNTNNRAGWNPDQEQHEACARAPAGCDDPDASNDQGRRGWWGGQ